MPEDKSGAPGNKEVHSQLEGKIGLGLAPVTSASATKKPRTERIELGEGYYLSPVLPGDIPQLLLLLNDREVYENTLVIPHPYLLTDAQWFVNFAAARRERTDKVLEWAIRDPEGSLIGGIGFYANYLRGSHQDEVGYWIGTPYCNKGIATRALRKICEFGFEELGYLRIEAPIYAHNQASHRVAEKCGFQREAYLKKAFSKDGKVLDGVLYALVKE
jgi:ribosomal-protein-alanine N-acetyltransferase